MAIWDKLTGKKSGPETGGDGNGKAADGGFKPDPRKARKFFEYGETTADSGNYDYSIECYINGLRHEPEAMSKHEALYEVGKRRKVKGGKPAGFGEKHKTLGPRPVDKMLQAEKVWAKDILNPSATYEFFKAAVEADLAHDDLDLGEVAYWIGGLHLDALATAKRPSARDHIKACDLFEQIQAYDKAVESCRKAASLNPKDNDMLQRLKELEASNAMVQGGYNRTSVEEGGFRNFVRDSAKQRALEQDESISKTANVVDQMIERRRAEYEEDPQDYDRMLKLVDALVQKEEAEAEKEAVELLNDAFEETGTYRYKLRAGDIKMKQMHRIIRALRTKLKENPNDESLKHQYEQARRTQLKFELDEFAERTKNYPTDLGIRYEYGVRLYQTGQIDEAIGAFQQAKSDPKRRTLAHIYLGQSYLQKGWVDEALDTLRFGLEQHAIKDDKQGLDLQYLFMTALEQSAEKKNNLEQAQEARELGSSILQTNINYRDIRQRVDKLRALVEKLSG